MLELLTIEFFFIRGGHITKTITLFGVGALLASFALRWRSTRALGKQWAIRVASTQGNGGHTKELIQQGPYRFIRHPIYLAYFLELIGLTCIPNCFYTLCFAMIVNMPLQIIRANIEERELLAIFGERYAAYRASTPAFVPRMSNRQGQRSRKFDYRIDFEDRRGRKQETKT